MTGADALNIHASCAAIDGVAVLLLGPPGSGKSDLCLRLVSQGGDLIADDRVELFARSGQLFAQPPHNLSGLIEIRGIGVMRLTDHQIPPTPVAVAVTLTPEEEIERMPPLEWETFCGVRAPHWRFDPFSAAVTEKVGLALRIARGDITVER